MQVGDVKKTHGDLTNLNKKIKLNKRINLKFGIKKFVKWYTDYYQTKMNKEINSAEINIYQLFDF